MAHTLFQGFPFSTFDSDLRLVKLRKLQADTALWHSRKSMDLLQGPRASHMAGLPVAAAMAATAQLLRFTIH